MILFLDDWKKHPNAIIQGNTSNHTFLKQAEAYRRMGVENSDFLLSLLDPRLDGVDPFSPDLTHAEMEMVGAELKLNPWYYYREVARITPQGSSVPEQIRANRGIIAFFWYTLNHIDIILIQPRQTGKSVGSDFQSNYILHIGGHNTRIALLTKDDGLREQNIERIKGLRDNLPYYVNPFNKITDGDNQATIRCGLYGNEIITSVPRSSALQARNIGRGMTAPICLPDETPFIPHIKEIIPAMLSSTNAARQSAMRNNGFYYNAFTTTAGDRSEDSGAYIYRLVNGGLMHSEKLYDCRNQVDLEKIVEKGSRGLKPIINATFSHRQLGISDAEVLGNIRRSDSAGSAGDRDYFNVWTNGGHESPIGSKALRHAIVRGITEATWTEITEEGYVLRWYISESEVRDGIPRRRIVMGIDPSDMVGNDALSQVLVDADTAEVIGTFCCNESNLFEYGSFLAAFIARFNHIVTIIERRGSGMNLIDSLIVNLPTYDIDPFKALYTTAVEDQLWEKSDTYLPIKQPFFTRTQRFYDGLKRTFGYATSGSGRHSRTTLYNRTLLQAAKLFHRNVRDETLVNEIMGVSVKNGRLDHASGKHDDMVIAWLLVTWFLTSTRNLDFYGLDGAFARAQEFNPDAETKKKTAHDDYEEQRIAHYRNQAELLVQQLADCRDSLIAMRIEARLHGMKAHLGADSEFVITFDSMIASARDIRAEKLKEQSRDLRSNRRW